MTPAEIAYSDISDERDDDAAHYELAKVHDEESERSPCSTKSPLRIWGSHRHHDAQHIVPPSPRAVTVVGDEPVPARDASPARGSHERDTGRYGRPLDTDTEDYATHGEHAVHDGSEAVS